MLGKQEGFTCFKQEAIWKSKKYFKIALANLVESCFYMVSIE